ncbi:MAG TPA: PH domain-containing protein, partial [Desulfobacterales bacterium]|nr:PH domain-containing protein [Desulfobacterales bacterium]
GIALFSLLRRQGTVVRRVVSIAIVVVVCGAILLFTYRPRHLLVDGQGLRIGTAANQSIEWSAVTAARLVTDLDSSPWALAARIGGTSIGEYRSGWFKLRSGATAYVLMEAGSAAVVVEGDGKTFVYAPKDFAAFVDEVAKHVALQRE